MDEIKIKSNIAKNIIAYRKRCNLTQAQLAEKISYSDKAISKWERGDGVPDLIVLLKLCEIFNVTLNDLIADKVKKQAPYFLRNRFIITLLSCLLVWLVAVLVFVLGDIVFKVEDNLWLIYIFAIPFTFIVAVVFSCLWGNKITKFLTITGLIWSVILSIYLPLEIFSDGGNPWMIFLVGIPLEALLIFWILLKKKQKIL